MNFAAFQLWRDQCLRTNPETVDCAETNLYKALALLQPKPATRDSDHRVHRCDLARTWLTRYGLPESSSRRAMVCRGVRHALSLIFEDLARRGAILWVPNDVYPAYLELARAAGIQSKSFATLPEPDLPQNRIADCAEYLLVANPWKPLGRFLTTQECSTLCNWLDASPHRYLIMDCVYDLGTPFHFITETLMKTGRAMLLHSVTKGWLWPKTFGIALLCEGHPELELAFRNDPPSRQQLLLAEQLLSQNATLPGDVVAVLTARKQKLWSCLPAPVSKSLLTLPAAQTPGCYFFPVCVPADELLRQHGIVAIPTSAFGGEWRGSVLTSLAVAFAGEANGDPP